MEQEQKNIFSLFFSHPVFRYVVILVILVIGIFLFTKQDTLRQSVVRTIPTPTVKVLTDEQSDSQMPSVVLTQPAVINRNIPWIEPVLQENKEIRKGETFSVELQSFSGGRDVTGYDILFSYDRDQFELVSVTSALSQYQVYQYERGSYITITGIKKLEENNPIVFDQTKLVKIEMRAKKEGAGTISILSESGKEKTQFVDSQVNPYVPQSGKLIVEME